MEQQQRLIRCSNCYIDQPTQKYYSKINKILKTCWSCRNNITCFCGHRTNTNRNHDRHVTDNHILPLVIQNGYVINQ